MLDRNPSICMVTRSLSSRRGGIPPAVRALSRALADSQSVAVEVLATEDDYTEEDYAAWKPITPRLFESAGPATFNYLPRLAGHMRETPSDLVHAHGIWLYHSVATNRWSRMTGKPYIVSPHGMLNPVALRVARWKKRLFGAWLYENRNLRNANCIHALSEFEYESIRAYGLSNPICVIPNGIEVFGQSAAIAERAPWSDVVPEGAKVLMFLGRLHPIKGLDLLINALGSVEMNDWHVALVGWAQNGHDVELKQLATRLNLHDKIHFLPAQFGDAKETALAHADAVVLPSRSEAFPVTLLEAWSHAKATAVSEAAMIQAARRNSAAVALGSDADSMAQGLRKLFAMSAEERASLGRRARSLVESNFNWNTVSGQFREIYDWLLGRGERPLCVRLD